MSKPYGYYTDPVFDRLRDLTPLQDWMGITAIVAVIAGLVGWMVPVLPVMLLAEHFLRLTRDQTSNDDFGWIYLVSVAVWVVPASTWAAFGIRREITRGER